ncbi:hypothetical protein ASF49_04465 [Methylobacterium sp. Leaf104]|uniref:hypothetical protein n=1 Tax=Methylobacterium TaxID=407 RepID=UPI0006FBC866|nr:MULTISPECIES: hypothetical protein [Methylobacterium]KQP38272.1 hypothetical protein ASF49_04465 [Methylobacterium sp. Leaf104]MCI9880339.1 hypothetical protein [Methylobacterium goesingense]
MDRITLLLHRRRDRRRVAALRLRSARLRFEHSSAALRRAALDHIDGHSPIGAMLRATLARLAAEGAGPA